ncbi:MAG: GtrA family protein [Gammaproteobacteria bacterium]|nr:GtrA family protein [Gammaproteobacteria bacterium]
MVKQAFSFWLIGLVGFAVDAAILYSLRLFFDTDLFIARFFSLAMAMTVSWYLNRKLTFAGQSTRSATHEWLYYLTINSIGAIINYSLFIWLVMNYDYLAKYLMIPLAISSGIAAIVNFLLSKYVIFRQVSK